MAPIFLAGGRYGPHFLKMAPKHFGRGPSLFCICFYGFLKCWYLLQIRHFGRAPQRESFPNRILLPILAIIHPVHTADCKRAFSSQNVITTSLRNWINSDHCNEQMKIMNMGAPLTEFNFSVALAKWRAVKQFFSKSSYDLLKTLQDFLWHCYSIWLIVCTNDVYIINLLCTLMIRINK